MAFKKGKSGNPDGRPKGAKNKVTQLLREHIVDYSIDGWDGLISDIESIDEPKERAKLKLELIKLILPKEHSIETDTDIEVVLKRRQPDEAGG